MTLTMLFLFRLDDGATSASLAMSELDDPSVPHSLYNLECQISQGASLRSMHGSIIGLYVTRWFSRWADGDAGNPMVQLGLVRLVGEGQ